jgi:hypothetical protein
MMFYESIKDFLVCGIMNRKGKLVLCVSTQRSGGGFLGNDLVQYQG